MTTKEQYTALVELINRYNYAYYVTSSPLVSDVEFDVLYHELRQMETDHPEWVTSESPTQHVGSDLKSIAEAVTHMRPMLSLDKVHTIQELTDFIDHAKRTTGKDITLYADHKYDGVSLSLLYVDGILTKALTRGDGNGGQDVTRNAVEILSIPKDIRSAILTHPLPQPEATPSLTGRAGVGLSLLEVRGEVLMTKSAFTTYNANCHKNSRPEYANERAAASAILLGSSPSACKMLTFMAWNVFVDNGQAHSIPNSSFLIPNSFPFHTDAMTYLSSLGFKNGGGWRMSDPTQIERFLNDIQLTRSRLKYPIDGVVFKIDDRTTWDTLGSTQTHPRWAMAYKYKTEEHLTTITDMEWSVSDTTGQVTPIAIYKEVMMYGTRCTRAKFNSYNNFLCRMNGIHKGDFLIVTKLNETIPSVVRWGVSTERTTQLVAPLKCPVCGETLKVIGNHLMCPRPDKHEAARKAKADAEAQKRLAERPKSFSKYALLGKKVVVTGTYVRFSEDEIKSLVPKCGGTLTSNVSGATDILVAGIKPGPSKMSKAQSYGTKIINEDEFLRLIMA